MKLIYRLSLIVLIPLLLVTNQTNAQANLTMPDSVWAQPINLSQSGATSQPRLVVDAAGSGHLLWRDQFQGFTYSSNQTLADDLGNWDDPTVVELPFSTRRFFPELQPTAPTPRFNPHLVADNNGRIHAFWLDNEDRLYHSSVVSSELTNFDAWSNRQQIAEAARSMSATLAPDGRIHIAYVRPVSTANFPAGIYHRRLATDAVTWTDPTLLYESAYLRGVAASEAHVHLTATEHAGTTHIHIGWDNRQRDQLFMASSLDNGTTWTNPRQVDSRLATDSPQAVAPSRILLHAQAATVLLTWQAGHNGRICDQYYQRSTDAGTTWSEPQPLTDQLPACPDELHLLPDEEGLLLLLARTEGQNSLLLAWNGSQWSEPQPQTALDTFVDPDTFRPIAFSCHQAVASAGYLWLAGCDEGPSQDIWLTGRPVGDSDTWFPPPAEEPAWQSPITVAEASETLAGLRLLAGTNGRFHASWSDNAQNAISYTRWDGSQWSRPSPVLRSPAGGQPGQPALAISGERLLAAWSDTNNGELLFSWANSERATAASEWRTPLQLPIPPLPIPLPSEPAIVVDRQDNIYIAYAVPINEGRGLYLVRSEDGGENWSPPLNMFDGTAAGWVAVGPPQLALAGNGRLYASWTQNSRDGQPQGLYLASSDDGGLSWSEETAVATGPVLWQQIIATDAQTIHQLWAGQGGPTPTATTQPALWHRVSTDSGQTWSRPARVAGLGQNLVGPASIALDKANQLHLVQLAAPANETNSHLSLYQWLWQDGRWQAEPPVPITHSRSATFTDPAAAAVADHSLGVIYLDWPTAADQPTITFSQRPIELPETLPTPAPTLAPTATPTPPPTATPLPQPTPTLFFPTDEQPGSSFSLPLPDDRLASSISGVIPALLLVIIAFIIGFYSLRRRP